MSKQNKNERHTPFPHPKKGSEGRAHKSRTANVDTSTLPRPEILFHRAYQRTGNMYSKKNAVAEVLPSVNFHVVTFFFYLFSCLFLPSRLDYSNGDERKE